MPLCNRDSTQLELLKHHQPRAGQSWNNGYCCKKKGKDALVSASNVRTAVFFFPVLRNTFNRIKQSRTSKAVTLLCLSTKNKKAVNNQASISVSCTVCLPSFSSPYPHTPPHPRAICLQLGLVGMQGQFVTILMEASIWSDFSTEALFTHVKNKSVWPAPSPKLKDKSSEAATQSNSLLQKCPWVRNQLHPRAVLTCKSRSAAQAVSTGLLPSIILQPRFYLGPWSSTLQFTTNIASSLKFKYLA